MKTALLILISTVLCPAQGPRLFTYYASPGVNWGAAKTSAAVAAGASSIALTGLPAGTIPATAQFTLSGAVYTVTSAVTVDSGSAALPVTPAVKAAIPAGTAISQWVWKSVILGPPLTLDVDATGQATITAPEIAFDRGFVTAINGNRTQVNLDTAYVVFRDDWTFPPAVPGKCDGGTGSIRADVTGLYMCITNADHSGFIWGRIPMQTTWVPGELASACTSDADGNVSCPGAALSYPPPIPVVSVYSETPVPDGKGGWTLAHPALAGGISCGRAGVLLIPGTDYTFDGTRISTTQDWNALGVPTCSYTYFQK